MTGPTVTYDTGEPGTWATAIAHSPTLDVREYRTPGRGSAPDDEDVEAGEPVHEAGDKS